MGRHSSRMHTFPVLRRKHCCIWVYYNHHQRTHSQTLLDRGLWPFPLPSPPLPSLHQKAMLSFRMATCQAYEAAPRASSEVCLVNSQAVKRDGDKCEVILAVGMIIASHEAWLGGQTVVFYSPSLPLSSLLSLLSSLSLSFFLFLFSSFRCIHFCQGCFTRCVESKLNSPRRALRMSKSDSEGGRSATSLLSAALGPNQ